MWGSLFGRASTVTALSVELRDLPDQVLDLVYPRIVGAVDVVGPVGDLERHEYRIEIDHLESPDLLIAGEYRQAVLPSDRIAEIGLREALVGYPRTSEVESAVVGIQRLDRGYDPSQVSFGGSAVEDGPEEREILLILLPAVAGLGERVDLCRQICVGGGPHASLDLQRCDADVPQLLYVIRAE